MARNRHPVYYQEADRGYGRHLAPWLLLVLVLGAGFASHTAWAGGAALPWITAGLSLAVAGLTWMAATVARARQVGPAGRAHVAATVAATGTWLLAATVLGPFARPVVDVWGLLGVLGAASWNLRVALHRPGRRGEDDDDDTMTPHKAGRVLMTSLGMRGDELQPDPKQVDANRVSGTLALNSGKHTVDDVQKRSHQIATALGIPKAGVRFNENPDNAARPEFSFTLRDVLGSVTPWPGPSQPGGTVFDPIPMGLYETGAVLRKTVADKAGGKHELIQGTTGSGKSSGAKVEICELMTRREVAIFVIDTVKGIQTFGPAAPGLAWFITTESDARRFMKRLMAVIRARTDYLGAHDLSEWAPGCGLTFLVVQIEEAGILLEELGDEFKNVVKAGRSAGIAVKVSLQRPSHDEMPTTARAQLGTISCYGMANDDPVCLLPEAVQDAGADPRRWGDRQPGCCYVAGTGITVAAASTPLRTFEATGADMARIAEQYGPHMSAVDHITTRAFGDLWTKRLPAVDLVARIKQAARGDTQPQPAEQPQVIDNGEVIDTDQAADDEQHHDEQQEAADVTPLTPEDMGLTTPDPDPDLTTSIDDELAGLGDTLDVQFGGPDPGAEITPEAARAAVAQRLADYEADGRDSVRVPDFSDLVNAGLRSRGWFRKELRRLVTTGRLIDEGDGIFRIAHRGEAEAA